MCTTYTWIEIFTVCKENSDCYLFKFSLSCSLPKFYITGSWVLFSMQIFKVLLIFFVSLKIRNTRNFTIPLGSFLYEPSLIEICLLVLEIHIFFWICWYHHWVKNDLLPTSSFIRLFIYLFIQWIQNLVRLTIGCRISHKVQNIQMSTIWYIN
jgi:hypothetical protein